MTRIAVTGGTGKLGRLVVERLIAAGLTPRVLTRDAGRARTLFGQRVDVAVADFNDIESLAPAFDGIERLFLLSPITRDLAAHQIAAARVASAAGVRRIVKISGSDWTIAPPGPSIAGAQHARVEDWLARSGVPSVSLRPNAWMQVSLPPLLAQIRDGRDLSSSWGSAAVALIDARDIADTAVHQLLAERPEPGPLVLTGPESLTLDDLAEQASRILGRPVRRGGERHAPHATGDHFHDQAVAEFMTLIAAGRAAPLTDTVARILGRPPRRAADWLAEALAGTAAQGATA